MKKSIVISLFLTINVMFSSINILSAQADEAFLIGDNQKYYDNLISEHSDHLLQVCDNSMDEAYSLWTALLKDVEKYSLEEGYDIKGIKMWVNVFWRKDGTLKNIVFYPKPNSKNADYDKLKEVLSNYIDTAAVLKENDAAFSHYGSASFPIVRNIPGSTSKQ